MTDRNPRHAIILEALRTDGLSIQPIKRLRQRDEMDLPRTMEELKFIWRAMRARNDH